MIKKRSEVDASDWLVIVGLLLLLSAIYLALGGVAALAFLGTILLVLGGYLAYARSGKRGN